MFEFLVFVFFFRDDGVNSVSERVDDSCFLFDMMMRVEVQVLVCVCFLSVDAKADRSVVFNFHTGVEKGYHVVLWEFCGKFYAGMLFVEMVEE